MEMFSDPANAADAETTAIFAGGCFWCMQPPFDNAEGVIATRVGYTGGKSQPTYHEVSGGHTGHYEAVEVTFDPSRISYMQLLEIFWRNIDPTQEDGQFHDIGSQYHTAIFYLDESQKNEAEASKAKLAASGKFNQPIATAILPAQPFYPAEEQHQAYYKKNPTHYNAYKQGSGRAGFIERNWKKKQ